MAELVYARDLKSLARNSMWVRIPLGLPNKKLDSHSNFITILIKIFCLKNYTKKYLNESRTLPPLEQLASVGCSFIMFKFMFKIIVKVI